MVYEAIQEVIDTHKPEIIVELWNAIQNHYPRKTKKAVQKVVI
jgi:hypothetical protein